jgi:hypothetical protein
MVLSFSSILIVYLNMLSTVAPSCYGTHPGSHSILVRYIAGDLQIHGLPVRVRVEADHVTPLTLVFCALYLLPLYALTRATPLHLLCQISSVATSSAG